MSINLQAETLANDLINFESREYEDEYSFLTYTEYTVRPTTPIPIYYEIQFDEEEEDNECMVIKNPNNRYLHQQADRNYAHGYRRPQINNLIVALLEPGTQPEDNQTTSHKSKSARKIELIDPLNSILDQPIHNDILLPLTLNSRIEILDVSPIEKIRKEIDKPSARNLIDVHEQRNYPLEVVKNLLIVVNRIKISINVEVTEIKNYAIIVGTDWLGKVKEKIDLAKGVLEYE
ncbi:1612_t:CDS:2 [Gigaspora margarita]|uniref:1612_t:CDS:1 n=1 Tax=Gigaspora margarita TaxID=4874 RepID=A0ABN7VVB3_GIGMA|nr:1612_t:CDS:2 [Gigaspora margarita]